MIVAKIALMSIAGFVFFLSPLLPATISVNVALMSLGFMSGTWIMYLLDMVKE